MNGWLLFGLFLIVGMGMLASGIVYMFKERNDSESVKIYRVISIVGAVLTIAAIVIKFVL